QHHLQDMQRSLDLFAPWLNRPAAPPELGDIVGTPAWQNFRHSLPVELPALGEAGAVYEHIKRSLDEFKSQVSDKVALAWCKKLSDDLATAHLRVSALRIGFQELAGLAEAAVSDMDFRFLFHERRQVFHIGYNASTEQLDPSHYDLLASEARIASLVAIAKGDVPQSHWQHLGRPVTVV